MSRSYEPKKPITMSDVERKRQEMQRRRTSDEPEVSLEEALERARLEEAWKDDK